MMVASKLLLVLLMVVVRRNAVRVVMMMMSMAMVVMMRMGMMMNMLRQRVCHPRWRPPYNVLFDWEDWEVGGARLGQSREDIEWVSISSQDQDQDFCRSAWNGSGWLG
jgi:hypothetical protein